MTTPATGGERARHDAWIAPFADEINEPDPDNRWARVVDAVHHRLRAWFADQPRPGQGTAHSRKR